MRSAEKPKSARLWQRSRSSYHITKVALAATVGLLLTAGFTIAPAGAAIMSTSRTLIGTMQPKTLKSCEPGANNSVVFYGWCRGSGPTSYRAIAYCSDGLSVYGEERWDGDERQSYANCQTADSNSTLNTQPDWGYILCSNNNGDGTYQAYENISGDISWMLANMGSGNFQVGGNYLCDLNTDGQASFNPNVPVTSS